MSHEKLQKALSAVPFLGSLTVQVEDAAPGSVTLTLGDGQAIRDHGSHIHSGALFSLGETAAGVALSTHPKLAGFVQFQRPSGIRCLRPCVSPPLAKAHIEQSQIDQIMADISSQGLSKTEVVASIQDRTGQELAEVVTVFSVRQAAR